MKRLLLLLFSCAAFNAFSQNEFLANGKVTDSATGQPLAGATVERVATGEKVTTDSQGRYTFAELRPGVHKFRASAPGMTAIERDLNLPADPPAKHNFELS